MKKLRMHKIAAVAVFILAAGWVLTGEFTFVGSAAGDKGEQSAESGEPAAEAVLRTVAFAVPPRIEHARTIRISGVTRADKRAELSVRTGGIVAELPQRQGEWVEAGALLLRLDPEERNAQIETARQLLEQREAELRATESLVQRGTLPTLRADEVRSAVAAARSQLELAQAELARMRIEAPFAGVLDRLTVEPGTFVAQNAHVATLVSLDPILAAGEVSEHDLHQISPGDTASVRLVDGRVVEGTLRYISREASSGTRTFPIEVALPNGDRRIPVGMTAEIALSGEAAEAVMLPRSVVTLSERGELGIRVLHPDDTVGFVPIDLIDDTPRGLVLGGVPADARVIVAGQDLVSEGERVHAVQADAETIRRAIREATGGVN